MASIITLPTDFGLDDSYVAAMKGVILGINPQARLVDICHSIKPQSISQGAFVLGTAYRFFPRRTVHLAVVDPGVGTGRRAVILRTPLADFVAPDNGILSDVLRQSSAKPASDGSHIELEPPLEAAAITRAQFWRLPVSPTFHGRDIFAPVAAHLSLGRPLADFGEAVTSLALLPLPTPPRSADGTLTGHIRHVDRFGNLITDISQKDLPPAKAITIEVGNQTIAGLSQTYADASELLALIGSSGYLEIAFREGDASARTGAGAGDEIIIRLQRAESAR